MSLLQSILYGLLSGITEFVPLSSFAHQQMYLKLCGEHFHDPVRDLLVHIALLLVIRVSCRPILEHMKRENKISVRRSSANPQAMRNQHFIKSATVPMIIAFFVLRYICGTSTNLLLISLFLMLNGVILFIPDRIITGNKDASVMSPFDSFLIGVSGALSVFPGISRLGCHISVATMRGADRQNALNWALLLSIPALWALIAVDLINVFTGFGEIQWQYLLHYILASISSFAAGYSAVKLIRFLSIKKSNIIFAYYSWGASLVAFFLYLTVA